MEEKNTPPNLNDVAAKASPPEKAVREVIPPEEQGQSILANIAFYLLTSSSALAGSFTYQMEARFQDGGAGKGDALRKRALDRIRGLLLDELCDCLEREPAVRRLHLSRDEIQVLSEQLLEKEILEERFEGNTYFLKARLVADPGKYADSGAASKQLEFKSKELDTAKERVDAALADLKRIEEEVRFARIRQDMVKALAPAPPGEARPPEVPHEDAGEPLEVELIEGEPSAVEETPKTREEEATSYLKMGATDYDLGRFDEAVRDFTRAIEQDPENPRALCARGSALVSLARFDEAMEDFGRAIALKRDMAEAYFNRAHVALLYKNDPRRAIADLGEAITLAPQDPSAFLCRGAAYERLGRHWEAIQDFTKAAQLSPQDPGPLFNRANAYLRSRESARAISDYTETLRRDPGHARALFNRAFAYAQQGEFEKAIEDFTRVLGLDPADAKAFLYRGHANYRLGRTQDALADWQIAARCGEETAVRLLTEAQA